MATEDFSELLLASRFYLKLELQIGGGSETVDAVFLECRRFQRSQKAISIVEVTANQWAKAKYGQLLTTHVPGHVATENLMLKRGLTNSMTLWNWFNQVELGQWKDHEAEGALSIFDQAGGEQARYDFQGAWPMRYTMSEVNAKSTEVAIEELELAVSSLTRSQ
ncbi:phage tail protein [Oscillatoria sp. CS-180]|uniref:phage tail protein n=1 Tax=Oscillatoria sp. CS-180 TaxID=3021720 RepID=UPI00232FF928|nr:phage tail protein [Oscillatoria sp. CS-180]MDB9526516.1 phage tail protein [Oscillatoria sp. CS-180]